MSKIAASAKYGGTILRKAIDYFSHLAAAPEWYQDMTKDTEFCRTEYFQKLKWLKADKEDIYNPDYSDILRVAFMSRFQRGKMKDLVSLLSGRDFSTKDYKEEIAEASFDNLKTGVLDFMNEYSSQDFILALKSAGFISRKLMNSQIILDFAYTLYLLLKKDRAVDKIKLKQYVIKWYVLTTLTSRYISSPETSMDADMRRIKEKGFMEFQREIEDAELSDTFWNIGLPQNLETSAINSPYFNVFIAAQINANANTLFYEGTGTKVSNLLSLIGDIHHIFPKQYLFDNNITDKSKYNQIGNYAFVDNSINIKIGKKPPLEYFTGYKNSLGESAFYKNLAENSIPPEITTMTAADYDAFLLKRRVLMAEKIRGYYVSL